MNIIDEGNTLASTLEGNEDQKEASSALFVEGPESYPNPFVGSSFQ